MVSRWPDDILNQLIASGFDAYYVGGCVRDRLLGRECHDWDITTSARPEQIMEVFDNCVPTGIQHGTVTVYAGDTSAEVTTFRVDGGYLDGRHPMQVRFVSTLREDLARRDFTINALAMSADKQIVDLFGGMEDLDNRMIRCIGDPAVRFQEDALRIFRAVRFSAQLGFSLDNATKDAAARYSMLCSNVSAERIRDELEKILMSDHPEAIALLAEIGALHSIADGTPECLNEVKRISKNRVTRWTAVKKCWDTLDLRNLRLDKRTVHLAMEAAFLEKPMNRTAWKHLISCKGKEVCLILADLYGEIEVVESILESGECVFLSDLAVNGSDFPNVKGKALGELLQKVLHHIHEYPSENKKENIFKFVKNSIDYYY